MSALDRADDAPADVEHQGARLWDIATERRTCTVVLPLPDGGTTEHHDVAYEPHLVLTGRGLFEERHPHDDARARVHEHRDGELWIAGWERAR